MTGLLNPKIVRFSLLFRNSCIYTFRCTPWAMEFFIGEHVYFSPRSNQFLGQVQRFSSGYEPQNTQIVHLYRRAFFLFGRNDFWSAGLLNPKKRPNFTIFSQFMYMFICIRFVVLPRPWNCSSGNTFTFLRDQTSFWVRCSAPQVVMSLRTHTSCPLP